MSEEKKDTGEITGLWENESKAGNTYWSAVLPESKVQNMIAALNEGRTKILVFKKTNREKDSHPHYDLLLVEPRK